MWSLYDMEDQDVDDQGSRTDSDSEAGEAVSMQVNGSDGTREPVAQKTLNHDIELINQEKESVNHEVLDQDREQMDQNREPVDQQGRDYDIQLMDQNREMVDQELVSQDAEILDQDREHALSIMSPPQTTVIQQQQQSKQDRQVWRLAEGVCEKRVLVKGQGLSTPCQGSTCQVIVDLPLHQLDLVPSLPGCSLGHSTIQMGEGCTPLSHLIDCALMSMKTGETADILLQEISNMQREVRLHMTLHEFTPATPPWYMTPTEKMTSAARRKEKGAARFKEGDVFAAFTHFRTATRLLLSILPFSFEEGTEDDKALRHLLCLCFLNLTACQMKTGHHQHVVTNCTQVLCIDPTNVKALYRRASAHLSLGNWLLAQEDLELGLRAQPSNRTLLELRRMVNAKLAHSRTQLAQGLSKMFS